MNDAGRRIRAAPTGDDRALLERLEEQGLIRRWLGTCKGAFRGAAIFATTTAFGLFSAAVYCGWRFAEASEASDAARWGVDGLALMVAVGFLKLWCWLRMESNRVLREIRRLELGASRRPVG